MNSILILAQVQGNGNGEITAEPVTGEVETTEMIAVDPNTAAGAPQGRPGGSSQLIMLGLMFVVMYFLLFRGPRKKQQQQKQMMQDLQKNDKVRTIGGIISTIVDVKDDVVTLKIDEANNTKIKVISSAIGKNMSDDKN
jgi:preprotein translocase subunit YajC